MCLAVSGRGTRSSSPWVVGMHLEHSCQTHRMQLAILGRPSQSVSHKVYLVDAAFCVFKKASANPKSALFVIQSGHGMVN